MTVITPFSRERALWQRISGAEAPHNQIEALVDSAVRETFDRDVAVLQKVCFEKDLASRSGVKTFFCVFGCITAAIACGSIMGTICRSDILGSLTILPVQGMLFVGTDRLFLNHEYKKAAQALGTPGFKDYLLQQRRQCINQQVLSIDSILEQYAAYKQNASSPV